MLLSDAILYKAAQLKDEIAPTCLKKILELANGVACFILFTKRGPLTIQLAFLKATLPPFRQATNTTYVVLSASVLPSRHT